MLFDNTDSRPYLIQSMRHIKKKTTGSCVLFLSTDSALSVLLQDTTEAGHFFLKKKKFRRLSFHCAYILPYFQNIANESSLLNNKYFLHALTCFKRQTTQK